MSKPVAVVWAGTLHAEGTIRVTGIKWELVSEKDEAEKALARVRGGRRNSVIGGCITVSVIGPVLDVYGLPESLRSRSDELIGLLYRLLEKAIQSLLDAIAPPPPPVPPVPPEVDDAWADDEEFRRIKREVEEDAKSHASAHPSISGSDPAGMGEPVAWVQVCRKEPVNIDNYVSVNVTDSRSIMGFRTAGGINRGKGVKLAVLDTGCRRSHPAIPSTVLPVIDCTGRGGGEQDSNGHGTFVVSQIVGQAPEKDPIGTARDVIVYPIQVMDSSQGWGADSWIARGIDTAVRLGCSIVSMSLGGSSPMPATLAALERARAAGVWIFAAAGNDGSNVGKLAYPAFYGECVSVGASDDNKVAATFSQGQHQCDAYACGVQQIGAAGPKGYALWDGTSMATPHMAAAAAEFQSWFKEVTGRVPTLNEMNDSYNKTDAPMKSTNGEELGNAGLLQIDGMLLGVQVPPPAEPPVESPLVIDVPADHEGHAYAFFALHEWLTGEMESPTVTFRWKGVKPPATPAADEHLCDDGKACHHPTILGMCKPKSN